MAIKDKDQVGTGIRSLLVDDLGLHTVSATPVFPPSTSFNAFIAALGSTSLHLIINRAVTLVANLTIPSNISVEVVKGGYINQNGYTLAISGSFTSGLNTAFTGTGAVTLSRSKTAILPEWWGALGDGTTDDYTALQAALTCAGVSGVKMVMLSGGLTYKCSATINIPSGVWLCGEGRRLAGLKFYNIDGTDSINFLNGYYQCLTDLNIDHDNMALSGTAVMFLDNDGVGGSDPSQYCKVENVRIVNHQTGIRVNGEITWAVFTDVNIEGCTTAYSVSHANFTEFHRCIANANVTSWYLEDTSKCVLSHCTAQVNSSTTIPAIQVVDCTGTLIEKLWCERNEFTCVLIKGSSGVLKSRFTRIHECWLNGAGFTAPNTGWGLDIGANCEETTVDGGRFGGNTSGDIRINASSSGNIIFQPHDLSAIVINDNATDTQYWDYTQLVINPPTSIRDQLSVFRQSLGVSTVPGLYLRNDTAAAAGAQQVSPAVRLKGSGWKTNATAASQTVEMRAYVLPIEGAAAPTAALIIERSINGGAWAEVGRFCTQGLMVSTNAAVDLGNPFFCQLSRDGAVAYAASRYSNDNTTMPSFTGRSAQGTLAAPTASLNGSPLVCLRGMGHDATSIQSTEKVAVVGRAIETWTGSANGTEIVLQVTPAGSTTMATMLTIRSSRITAAAPFSRTSTTGIVASTTQTQLQGQLTTDINIVSTVANANDTVTLPAAVAGAQCYIRNNGANTLKIYPFTSGNINGTGVNASVTLAAGASVTYRTADSVNWYS